MHNMQDDEYDPDYDSKLSLSAEFVRIALGILRTYHKRDNVPDVHVTMAFVSAIHFVGIHHDEPHLTVKLLSTVSGLRLSAAALPPATALGAMQNPDPNPNPQCLNRLGLGKPNIQCLNTADQVALLTFVERITRTDQLFNVVLRIEAFPNTPALEDRLMRRLLMALHPYKHGWAVDTVLPPGIRPETLLERGPSTKPSVIWMYRYDDDLFSEPAARQLANEFYVWMLSGLGLNKYSEDDFNPETDFIHVEDDFVPVILYSPTTPTHPPGKIMKVPRLGSGTLVPDPNSRFGVTLTWKGWDRLLLPTELGLEG